MKSKSQRNRYKKFQNLSRKQQWRRLRATGTSTSANTSFINPFRQLQASTRVSRSDVAAQTLAPVTSTNAVGNLASLSTSILDSSDDTETMPTNCHFESTVVANESTELNAATMPIAVEDESTDFQGEPLLSNERDLSFLDSTKAWSILEPNVPHAAVTRLLQCLNNFHP